jgi:hypothetical protein
MNELLTQVYAAIDRNWSQAAYLADKGALQAAPGTPEKAVFTALSFFAHACETWDASWEYEQVFGFIDRGKNSLKNSTTEPVFQLLNDLLEATRLSVSSEKFLYCYQLTRSHSDSQQACQLFERIQTEYGHLNLAEQTLLGNERWLAIARRRFLVERSMVEYLEAYQALNENRRGAQALARKTIKALTQAIRDLETSDSIGEAQEVRAYLASLQRVMEMQASTADQVWLNDVQITWTFRKRMTDPRLQELFEQWVTPGDTTDIAYERKAALEQMCELPIQYIGQASLNDIFVTEIGQEAFTYVDFVFPPFPIQIEHVGRELEIEPVLRLYAAGIVSVRLAAYLGGQWSVSHIQHLRGLGLEQFPFGDPFTVDWFHGQSFDGLGALADGLFGVLEKLLGRVTGSGESEPETLSRPAHSEWVSHALLEVDSIEVPENILDSVHACELAALSQPMIETQDSLDAWMRLTYHPDDNLAPRLNLGEDSLLFVSNDHVLFCTPLTADWVQAENMDMVEFMLNIPALVFGHLHDLREEINRLQRESRIFKEYTARLTAPKPSRRERRKRKAEEPLDLEAFTLKRMEDIVRLNNIKSEMLSIRKIARAADVARFVEHRLLLEGVGQALNLQGAITQAEYLIEGVMAAHQEMDDIGQVLYQQQVNAAEQRRAKFENVLALVLQILGWSQVVSSVISIIIVGDAEGISIPLWAGQMLQASGQQVKLVSIWAMLTGILVILLSWILLLPRRRKP